MFSFLKRNAIIITLAIVIVLVNGFLVTGKQKASFHTTIFTTIANQSPSSSEENEQASTYFGETLMGWFRNPAFLEKIYTQAETKGNLSAHKQERQNLIIEIEAYSELENEKLAEATLGILESEINSFNQNTQNNFTLLNLGVSTYQNPIKNTLFILAAFLIGLFVAVFGIIIVESISGLISLPVQIESLFKKNKVLSVDTKKTTDLEYIATLCLNTNNPIIFAGADFDHSDLTVQTAIKANEIEKNLILVDGDLKEKKLHLNLGLSDMMKNLKGLTDRVKKGEKLAKFVHKALDGNLNFLAAGNGADVILEDLAEQLEEHKTILIHTVLPENFPILTLADYSLFLFVKPGKTKIKTLKKIQALKVKNLKIFVV